MPTDIYSGHEQPDSASVVVGGVLYRCYVFIDNVTDVRAVCFIEQEHGQSVELFSLVVGSATAGSTVCDCPRILVSNDRFVVHWLEGETGGAPDLYRSIMDMGSYGTTSTWSAETTLGVGDAWLYDARPVIGDTGGDYVVVFRNAAGTAFQVRRYDPDTGDGWNDQIWTHTNVTSATDFVLALYASEGDDSVFYCYQSASDANRLYGIRMDADGANPSAEAEIFTAAEDCDFTQVGICNIDRDTAAVVCEAQEGVSNDIPQLLYRAVRPSTLALLGNEHRTWHLRMLSMPFAYAGTRTDGSLPDCYCYVGYQHASTENEWNQAYAYVMNLNRELWTQPQFTIRARPMSTITGEIMEARVAGYTPAGGGPVVTGVRTNHVCAVSEAATSGPGLKTRVAALVYFPRIMKIRNSTFADPVTPINASVAGFRFYVEDAWMYHRDSTDPAQPSANFRAPYPQTQYQSVEVQETLVISGGTPQVYDGHQCVELGYLWAPEILSMTRVAGNLGAGTYTYTFVWEWRGRDGRLHRSPPADPRSLTVIADSGIDIDVSTMTASLRDATAFYSDARSISLVPYRTTNGGTVFYRVFASSASSYQPEDTPDNDPDDYRVQYSGGALALVDAEIVDHDVLPFQLVSGVWTPLAPEVQAASGAVAAWKNRVWMVDSITNALRYSLELLPEPGGSITAAPEFNAANVYDTGGIGKITALQDMDDHLVLFTRDGIYGVSGEPNDGTGAGSTLRITTISRTVGCIEPRSVVLSRNGVFFQSFQGYNLLTRTLEVNHLQAGAAVEDAVRTGGNIRDASDIPDRHEIRLVTNGAVAGSPLVLAYNYLYNLWSSFPLPDTDSDTWLSATTGGCSWYGLTGSAAHVVCQQGGLLIERPEGDANEFADEAHDGNQAIPIDIESGWINFAGIHGFRRAKKVQVQLYKPQDSEVSVDVYYDVSGAKDDSTTDSREYGSPAPAVIDRYFSRQKYPFRLRVYESGTVPLTENLSIVSFAVQIGVLSGHRRLPAANQGT